MDTDNFPMPWSMAEILEATGGILVSAKKEADFRGFFIDSRLAESGHVFVAIRGRNHDGHNFIGDAIKNGCRALIVCRDVADTVKKQIPVSSGVSVISVDDTVKALGLLGKYQRQRAEIRVIAVTGSSGKTSTRAMISSIVSGYFRTLSTSGNFNNDIGLPLTLLKLSCKHELAVLEIGASNPGEISRLAEMCRPDFGVITNIGYAHLEGFGSLEGVAAAKIELVHALGSQGVAILNADDPFLKKIDGHSGIRAVYFGSAPDADVRGRIVEILEDSIVFDLFLPDGEGRVKLKTPGAFMMMNALAAAAAAWAAGLSAEKICAGLENFEPEKGRLDIKLTKNGTRLIDDTYNANPSSMLAAIRTLASLKGNGRRFLVCGDMLELGEKSEELHESIGMAAAENGLDGLFIYGVFSQNVKKGAVAGGMNVSGILTGEKKELAEKIESIINADDWILVKGSRSTRMEEIVDSLIKKTENTEESTKK